MNFLRLLGAGLFVFLGLMGAGVLLSPWFEEGPPWWADESAGPVVIVERAAQLGDEVLEIRWRNDDVRPELVEELLSRYDLRASRDQQRQEIDRLRSDMNRFP